MAERPAYVWSGSDWDTIADPGAVRKALVVNSGKGSLITTNGTSATALAVGANGFTLVADSAASNGIKWAAPSGGSDIDPLFLAGV